MTEHRQQFWGKYRARVTDNGDPYQLGRLKLSVPDVLGSNPSGWALPAFPYATSGTAPGSGGGVFFVPPVDAWVWAEFEHGDPDKPIWTGCFFPADPTALPAIMTSLLPLTGIDPSRKVIKVGKWVVTLTDDTLTIEHLAAVVPRTRVKIDDTTIKLTTEPVPGAAAPACATIELSSSRVSAGGMPVQMMGS